MVWTTDGTLVSNASAHQRYVVCSERNMIKKRDFRYMRRNKAATPVNIPDATIHRLLIYHRTLDILGQGEVETVSSQRLAEIEGFSAAQVRKDLSYFGSFGHRGVGYNIAELKAQITNILGLNQKWNIVLIGAGHLADVLMNSRAFRERNFYVSKIFERSPRLIGKIINHIVVSDMNNLEDEIDPATDRLGVIALPPDEIQDMVNRLSKIGVKGILYFAARTVEVPDNLVVRNQDVSIELGKLTYHIANDTKRQVTLL